MAAYVFEKGHKPHELRQAQNIQRWGDPYGKGWRHWPFGMLDRLNAVTNIYDVCRSWQATTVESQGEWIETNPTAWEHIIAPLMEREMKDGKSESWL